MKRTERIEKLAKLERMIRVKNENAERFIKSLHRLGFTASYSKTCYTTWGNGCSDPECCDQHVSFIFGGYCGIITNCSGTLFHKLLEEGFLC